MECNKDEAVRAREIAEKKFRAKDIPGAKKFALKASQLYPALEGICQMISTFDVYIAAEKKINGETDWYEILNVNAMANDDTVKKQYRKLALMLHPDKNKSIGAEGAFKLISEAWSVLSDKIRRSMYDHKRNITGTLPKVPPTARAAQPPSSRPPNQPNPRCGNGFYTFPKNNAGSSARAPKATSRPSVPQAAPPPPPPPPASAKSSTFWTTCNGCKMQYEYLRMYVNQNLLCPNCQEPFYAVETGTVPTPQGTYPWANLQQRGPSIPGQNAYVPSAAELDPHQNANFQFGPFSRAAGVASSTASSSSAAAAVNVVTQTYEKVRRDREEAQAAAKREEIMRRGNDLKRTASGMYAGNSKAYPRGSESYQDDGSTPADRVPKKMRSMDGNACGDPSANEQSRMGNGKMGVTSASVHGNSYLHRETAKDPYEFDRMNNLNLKGTRFNYRLNNGYVRELASLEGRAILMSKGKGDILKKIGDLKPKKLETKGTDVEEPRIRDLSTHSAERHAGIQHAEHVENGKNEHMKYAKNQHLKEDADADEKDGDAPSTINVIDPDFHDFDNDRSEASFEANQVWAAYDNDDGMPRFYALIHKVISIKPFRMKISWLNSKNNSDLGPMNWIASGFTKTCGDFRIGKHEINKDVNIFSHSVRLEKLKGVIRVVPQKGDVWALYRNWSKDWNESTPDEVIHEYDMVEVLDDYTEDSGISVVPLVKVAGFKTVFQRHSDSKMLKRIIKEEMFRFSHQVPTRLLTGEEAQHAPKGCLELDPAAIPSELLEVITESKADGVVKSAEG